jgi:hypothetical protein
MPLVHHPDFPQKVKDVPTEDVKDWTDQGWVRVKKDEEDKVRAQSDLPPVA